MGLSEKSGSPFFALKYVERIAKNRASGAKPVQRKIIKKLFFGLIFYHDRYIIQTDSK